MNEEIEKEQTKLSQLPPDITISTITIHCKIDIKFNILNLINHWPKNNPYVIIHNTKKRNNNKKNNMFFNQVPININISKKNKPISIKLFTNGTIHLTGCKSIHNVTDALNVLFNELKSIQSEFEFVDDLSSLKVENLKQVKIAMINSNFTMPFNIDRTKLFECLKKDKITSSYDSLIHAGVIIRHTTSINDNKIITILVFEKGAIIITGARNYQQILSAYNFINQYILSRYHIIKKEYININDTILLFLQNNSIARYIL